MNHQCISIGVIWLIFISENAVCDEKYKAIFLLPLYDIAGFIYLKYNTLDH